MIEALFHELSSIPQVEAIALGGSRAGDRFDATSDYDVYLYCTAPVPEEIRRNILGKYCSIVEIGNQFWELEDNCQLKNGIPLDLLYRDLDSFVADVATVVEQFQARNGYTTCMWHNLLQCKILYDRDGRLAAAKARFDVPYPEQLQENIIFRNYKLLQSALPAYRNQISKALRRKDLVSMNHRVSAFMESYFDILFALNELTHPGEKRLMSICKERCQVLPAHFEENLYHLFFDLYSAPDRVDADIANIIGQLQRIL